MQAERSICRCGEDHSTLRQDRERVQRELRFIGLWDCGLVLELYNCSVEGTLSIPGIGPSQYAEDYEEAPNDHSRQG